jgi:hypothetical protein
MQGRLSLNAQNSASLFLIRTFSGKRHNRGLPLVVLSFCLVTTTFANGAASSFCRTLIVKPVYSREAARQGCGEFVLKAMACLCLDDRLAPCRSSTKFLENG